MESRTGRLDLQRAELEAAIAAATPRRSRQHSIPTWRAGWFIAQQWSTQQILVALGVASLASSLFVFCR